VVLADTLCTQYLLRSTVQLFVTFDVDVASGMAAEDDDGGYNDGSLHFVAAILILSQTLYLLQHMYTSNAEREYISIKFMATWSDSQQLHRCFGSPDNQTSEQIPLSWADAFVQNC
jgi:hypothetical protein